MSVAVPLGPKKKTYKTIRAAAEAAGINYVTFYQRLKAGLSAQEAIKKPVRKYKKAK